MSSSRTWAPSFTTFNWEDYHVGFHPTALYKIDDTQFCAKYNRAVLVAKFESRHGLEATLEVFYSKYFIKFVFTPLKIKKLCGFCI